MCLRVCLVAAVAFVLAVPLHGLDPAAALVPWKIVKPGEEVRAPLIVFWVPASADEVKRSSLLVSTELTRFTGRCVAMRIVRIDDRARLARLGAGDDLPAVIIAEPGAVVSRVTSSDGHLALSEVESAVRAALDRREGEVEAMLDEADARAADHDFDTAKALYRKVAEQRCICPRQARDASRALSRLKR